MDAQSLLGDPGIPLNAPITVVIPTSNQVNDLIDVLSSIQSLDGPLPETIVVQNGIEPDNNADDKMIRRFERIKLRIVHDKVPGQLSGRHRGLLESDAEILVFIDDDVVLSNTWLGSIREAFQDPMVTLVGGPSTPVFETEPPNWLTSFWQPALGQGRMLTALSLLELDVTEPTRVDPTLIWGLNFAIRRSTLVDCGGFHPDCVPSELQHFQGDGETGLCMKIAAANHKAVYHPGARVHHRVGSERMTHQYFDQRYFYQGVCDSYTQIRTRTPMVIESKTMSTFHAVRSVAAQVKRSIIGKPLADPLGQRFANAYQRGFDFHQACVSMSPALRRWVLRDTYFDYDYPALESGFVRPKRQVHQS